MSKLKLGILSFAHLHGAGYLSLLAGRSDVEVRVSDIDAERGQKIASSFGVEFVPSYDELLAWEPAGAIVCSENSVHRSLTEKAAAAGAHVLCEKPLATSLADGQAMIKACEAAGVNLMTAFPMRFSAPVRGVESVVREGRLGKIYGVAGTNPGQMPGMAHPWFVDPELAGGGSMMDHTVHVADLLRWILDSEATSVYAQTNKLMYPDLPVETAGTLAVTFENGTVATIDCSWSRPESYPTWGGVTLELVGENGIASMDAFRQTYASFSDGPGRQGPHEVRWNGWGSNADAGMLDEFISSIREGRAPRPNGWDGYRATEIAMGGYKSVESGQPVALPLTAS